MMYFKSNILSQENLHFFMRKKEEKTTEREVHPIPWENGFFFDMSHSECKLIRQDPFLFSNDCM